MEDLQEASKSRQVLTVVYIAYTGHKMLQFIEQGHVYTLDNKVLKSVSSIVASQFRKFNSHAIANAISKKKNEDSPYHGMTKEDILHQWNESGKESRNLGMTLHRNIELFYRDGVTPQDSPEWQQFMQFHKDHPDWNCIANEFQVHNDKVAGTIDAIFDTPDGIVLVDWKRCKAMDFSGYGMGRGVMKHVADCNYSKYSLQLSLYKALCKIEVTSCFIVQMHPSLEKYQKIRAQNFHIEAKQLLSF